MKKLLVFVSVFVLGVSNMAQVAMATSVSDNTEEVVVDQPTEEEPAAEEEPTTEATTEETPAEETPAEETPAEETPTEETPTEETPTEETPVEESPATIVIPDFTGQNYEEVREQMEAVAGVSWMLEYIYSDEVAEDVIISQNVSGEVALAENYEVNVVISLGSQPEVVEEEKEIEMDLTSPIGLGSAFGDHGIGLGDFSAWDNMPFSYEYVYDNSAECWNWGVWYEGVCYTTPEGEYSNDVRHKISLYTDGVNVYCYIRFATCYGPGFNSEDLQFYVNGEMAAFQLTFKPDGVITGNVDNLEPGVYEVQVKHRNSALSYTEAEGSKAYLQIDAAGKNNAVEMVIPLDTLKEQNPAIDLSRIDSLEFFSPNLMYRRVKCSGANTAPFVWAAAALVGVPAGAMIYRKKSQKKEQ